MKKHDFTALSAVQMKAARILAGVGEYGEKRWKIGDIAAECGVDTSTLYRWRQDDLFIAYKNEIAEQAMDEFIAEAYSMLKGIARDGSEKNRLKAMELALKNRGKLTDVHKVEAVVEDKRTNDAIEAEIDRLRKELGE